MQTKLIYVNQFQKFAVPLWWNAFACFVSEWEDTMNGSLYSCCAAFGGSDHGLKSHKLHDKVCINTFFFRIIFCSILSFAIEIETTDDLFVHTIWINIFVSRYNKSHCYISYGFHSMASVKTYLFFYSKCSSEKH